MTSGEQHHARQPRRRWMKRAIELLLWLSSVSSTCSRAAVAVDAAARASQAGSTAVDVAATDAGVSVMTTKATCVRRHAFLAHLDGACVGVVVAPTLVLAPTHCVTTAVPTSLLVGGCDGRSDNAPTVRMAMERTLIAPAEEPGIVLLRSTHAFADDAVLVMGSIAGVDEVEAVVYDGGAGHQGHVAALTLHTEMACDDVGLRCVTATVAPATGNVCKLLARVSNDSFLTTAGDAELLVGFDVTVQSCRENTAVLQFRPASVIKHVVDRQARQTEGDREEKKAGVTFTAPAGQGSWRPPVAAQDGTANKMVENVSPAPTEAARPQATRKHVVGHSIAPSNASSASAKDDNVAGIFAAANETRSNGTDQSVRLSAASPAPAVNTSGGAVAPSVGPVPKPTTNSNQTSNTTARSRPKKTNSTSTASKDDSNRIGNVTSQGSAEGSGQGDAGVRPTTGIAVAKTPSPMPLLLPSLSPAPSPSPAPLLSPAPAPAPSTSLPPSVSPSSSLRPPSQSMKTSPEPSKLAATPSPAAQRPFPRSNPSSQPSPSASSDRGQSSSSPTISRPPAETTDSRSESDSAVESATELASIKTDPASNKAVSGMSAPTILKDLGPEYGYVTSANCSAGIFGVLVAPRFVLLDNDWLHLCANPTTVLFQSEEVSVKRVTSEVPVNASASLALFTLVELTTAPSAKPKLILRVRPDFLYTYIGLTLTRTKETTAITRMKSLMFDQQYKCKLRGDAARGQTGCVSSSEIERYPVKGPGFLTFGSFLVGLAFGSPVQWSEEKNFQGIARVGADVHMPFFDKVTDKQVTIVTDNIYLRERQTKFPSYVASLVAANGDVKDCTGVLIAPKYALTTASCIGQSSIHHVEVKLSSGIEKVYVRGRSTLDSKFKTSSDESHDFALLELENEASVTPVGLSNSTKIDSNGVLVRYDQYYRDKPVEITSNVTWVAMTAMDVKSQRDCELADGGIGFCVTDFNASDCNTKYKNTLGSVLIIVNENGREVLAGFHVHVDTDECGSFRYNAVISAKDLINRASSGHKWGEWMPDESAVTPVVDAQSELPPSKQYIVGLRETRTGQTFCGGTLISAQYVLTAAHCVLPENQTMWAAIGSMSSSGESGEIIPVVSRTAHPLHGMPNQYSYDVAVLELRTAAYASPIKLDNSLDYDGERATMYGYGQVSPDDHRMSPVVRQRNLPLLSTGQCRGKLPEIDKTVLCAGGEGGNDACLGDSGGPLVLNSGGVDYLVGVVSTGYGCGVDGIPGIYMRVASMADFINAYVVFPEWRWNINKTISVPSDPNMAAPSLNAPGLVSPISNSSKTNSSDQWMPLRSGPVAAAPNTTGNVSAGGPALSSMDGHMIGCSRGYDRPVNMKPLNSSMSQAFRYVLARYLLVGDYSNAAPPTSLVNALASSSNVITLYSQKDVVHMNSIIEDYAFRPLFRRKDRFQTTKSATRSALDECDDC